MYQVHLAPAGVSKVDTQILLQAHHGSLVGNSSDSTLCAADIQLFLSVAERADSFVVSFRGGRIRGGGESILCHGSYRAVFLSVVDDPPAILLYIGDGVSSASHDCAVELRMDSRFDGRIRQSIAGGTE